MQPFAYNSNTRESEMGHPWESLASQPSQVGELQVQ